LTRFRHFRTLDRGRRTLEDRRFHRILRCLKLHAQSRQFGG
jgi:hypothetical protein